jgi:sigma-B regulation protein RsbU (phosphoserine phosphatase)
MAISPGDRFLLYTDGIVEPENARGNAFGDSKLEEVVHNTESGPASELVDQLLTEIKLWQSASISQQDDITLVVVDVL